MSVLCCRDCGRSEGVLFNRHENLYCAGCYMVRFGTHP